MICGYLRQRKWNHFFAPLCEWAAKYPWFLGLICYERGICPEA